MLPLPPFALARPSTVEEAVALLAAHPEARVIAGGTDLLPSMKYGLFAPPLLVSTAGLPTLRQVAPTPAGGLALGAGLSLRELRRHPALQAWPALTAACATVATPTIQAMGTLGGNLLLDTRCVYYNQSTRWRTALGGCLKCATQREAICHVAPKGRGCYAAHSADTVPVLMVLGAQVELRSAAGSRTVPVADLYSEDGREGARLRPGELLTRVLLPPPTGAAVVHRKLRARAAIDYPLLLVAARVDAGGGRVVVSAVGPRPMEVQGVAEALARGGAEAVAELAHHQVQPLGTHNQSAPWRKRLVRVEVRRAVQEALALYARQDT